VALTDNLGERGGPPRIRERAVDVWFEALRGFGDAK
jgi:hypothetical protein